MKISDLNDIPEEMIKRLNKAKDLVLNEKNTQRIISHYDADGICAAGILSQTFLREGLKFHVTLTKNLSEDYIEVLAEDEYPITIFCDMGSSQLKSLSKFEGDVIIFDHHVTLSDSEDPLLINTNLFEIPGTDEMCASSLSFLFSLVMNKANWDLSSLGLAGCIGDKQHLNGLCGFNAFMVETASEMGIIEQRNTVKLDAGRIKKSLLEGLDPYIKGMSGREEAVLDFLKNVNLNPDMKTEDLSDNELRILSSAIIVKLLAQGTRPERAVCLGDEEALKRSIELRKIYKEELRKGMMNLESHGPEKLDHLQYFYVENPSLAGAHAGLGMMYIFDQEMPTIALSVLKKETRVSSRGTKYLVEKGLDLALTLREAAEEVGGSGGGHPVASGATIPLGKEDAFLELVDYIVGKQMKVSEDKNEDTS
jgi:RecJ-like exonuclease